MGIIYEIVTKMEYQVKFKQRYSQIFSGSFIQKEISPNEEY